MAAAAVPLAFDIWGELRVCPLCGSDFLEIDLMTDEYVCGDCEARSASFLSDGMEDSTWEINDLDRFDFLALFDLEQVGGD